MLAFLALLGAPYIYDISSLRVKQLLPKFFHMFYISSTVHLGIILVKKQLDALFSMYLFISLLYMFRATPCSSSGESNFVTTSSGIYCSA